VGARRTALQEFVHRGGGIVGIHAAADSHHHWPWYGQMMGGYFDRHPASPNVRPGTLRVVDHDHPSTRNLPEIIERQDEWYLFRDFNPLVDMLIVADVASVYDEGSDPLAGQWFTTQTNTNTRLRMPETNPKPIAWRHEFEGARVFYTAIGHVPETFSEPLAIEHIAGGLRWALSRED
jgi:type 1 glutamine amidotransferase